MPTAGAAAPTASSSTPGLWRGAAPKVTGVGVSSVGPRHAVPMHGCVAAAACPPRAPGGLGGSGSGGCGGVVRTTGWVRTFASVHSAAPAPAPLAVAPAVAAASAGGGISSGGVPPMHEGGPAPATRRCGGLDGALLQRAGATAGGAGAAVAAWRLQRRSHVCHAAPGDGPPPDEEPPLPPPPPPPSLRSATGGSRELIGADADADLMVWDPWNDDPRATAGEGLVDVGALLRVGARLEELDDCNLLQTALAAAIQVEDYALAARVRDRLTRAMGPQAARIDWAALNVPHWLSDRLERLGFRFPTEVQRRTTPVVMSGCDAAVASETGSGKTLSFLAPTIARLNYPPDLYPGDLKGPQAIIVVPTMELGVQVCLLAYRIFGGSVSRGDPGDQANMYTYMGPKEITVRGLLNKEEVVMAQQTPYLHAAHIVVATPASLVEVLGSGGAAQPSNADLLHDLRVLVVDEFDECLETEPEATMIVLSAAANHTKPRAQVVLVGATLKMEQVSLSASAGWIQDPVVIRTGGEGGPGVPSSLKHRFVVVDKQRRLATLVRMLRSDLEAARAADPDGGWPDGGMPTNRTIVFANSPADAAMSVEPLRSALWKEHAIGLLLPPGSPTPRLAPTEAAEAAADAAAAGRSSGGDGIEPEVLPANPADPEAADSAIHELAGSSPFSATDPIRALLAFRDRKTSLLLCTPPAARGLDLPSVSHVYNIGCPADATQYLHRAGRAGRIGSTEGGTVTTIVTPDELDTLARVMADLRLSAVETDAVSAGVPLIEMSSDVAMEALDGEEGGPVRSPEQVEKLRKGLEDIFNLL